MNPYSSQEFSLAAAINVEPTLASIPAPKEGEAWRSRPVTATSENTRDVSCFRLLAPMALFRPVVLPTTPTVADPSALSTPSVTPPTTPTTPTVGAAPTEPTAPEPTEPIVASAPTEPTAPAPAPTEPTVGAAPTEPAPTAPTVPTTVNSPVAAPTKLEPAEPTTLRKKN